MGTPVIVYGVQDCARCVAVKGALHEAGINYEEKHGTWLVDPGLNPDWRHNGSVVALASLVFQGWNLSEMPVLKVGEEFIPAADLSSITIDGKTIALTESGTVHCEGGACSLKARPLEEVVAA